MAFSFNPYRENEKVVNLRNQMNANSVYHASAEVEQAKNNLNNLKAPNPYVSAWQSKLAATIGNIQNRKPFTYDVNNDPLYQQYKNNYINQGRQAMIDTMGQASALTGGYGNSYAATVGNQTYQNYLSQLNNVIPSLYKMAQDKYAQDTTNLYNLYNMYNEQETKDYGKYRDKVSDYRANRDYLTNRYNSERNFDYGKFTENRNYWTTAYNNERNFDYSKYQNEYKNAFTSYQQQIAQDQWNKEYALKKAADSRAAAAAARAARAARASRSSSQRARGTHAPIEKVPVLHNYDEAVQYLNKNGTDGSSAGLMTPHEWSRRKYGRGTGAETAYGNYKDYINSYAISKTRR
ncbi:MAG: hypothetical protein ACTTIO_04370 [Candidatus Fimenecus sp.]